MPRRGFCSRSSFLLRFHYGSVGGLDSFYLSPKNLISHDEDDTPKHILGTVAADTPRYTLPSFRFSEYYLPPSSNLLSFIEANPREVLIVEFDMGDGTSADLRTALVHSGLIDYVYVPPGEYAIEWPTLGDMIEAGSRLVLFGAGDGMASCPANKCKDGMLHAADHMAETSSGYGADMTGCEPSTAGEVLFSLFRLNHYVEKDRQMPSPGDAREMNAYANLEKRMENCREAGYLPNLLTVEFWDEGDAVAFAHDVTSGNIGGGGGDDDEGRRRLRSPGRRDEVSMRKN